MTQQKGKIDWNTFRIFVEEFKSETDRAAVVLGAAKLDTLLFQILEQYLLPTTSTTDELLEGDSPMSTFSARINSCYRLGLISSDFAKSLHIIRKIRNSFAHDISGCSLNSGAHGDRVKSLLLPMRGLPFFKEFRRHFFGSDESNSIEFRCCLALMAIRLEARLSVTKAIPSDQAWNFIQKGWANPTTSENINPKSST